MIYTMNYLKRKTRVDTDKIARRFLNNSPLYIRPYTHEDRCNLIEYLENEGFHCIEDSSNTRQETIESGFPLVIELGSKTIGRMGNVTSAAAAASGGVIMSDKDFYLLYSLYTLRETNKHKE